MNIYVLEKTYPGSCPRPASVVEVSEKDQLVIISTPWGDGEASDLTHASVKEFFEAVASDPEATSPFQRLPGLSPTANYLRISTMLANEALYQKVNRDSYNSACEILILNLKGRELSWVQVGQPSLLLIRNGKIIPLSTATDLSLDFNAPAPLPGRLLGIEKSIEMETKSVLMQEGDLLIALCRQSIPQSLLTQRWGNDPNEVLQQAFQLSSSEDEKMPFWLGIVQITLSS